MKQRIQGITGERRQLSVVAAVKRKSAKQVACSKTVIGKPAYARKLERMCQDISTYSRERQQDAKSGIICFHVSKDPQEGHVFHFWEVYESDQAFASHTGSVEMKAFLKNISTLVEGPPGMVLYEIKDGHIGMAATAEGPKGEGGLDDATGSGGCGGASYKQTSRVVNLGTLFVMVFSFFVVCIYMANCYTDYTAFWMYRCNS